MTVEDIAKAYREYRADVDKIFAKLRVEMSNKMTVEDIARVCYEVNKAYCESHGDLSFGPWESAPDWQRRSNINGVLYILQNPSVTPAEIHGAWVRDKHKEGWSWDPIKNVGKKEHPNMVMWDEMSTQQQAKDYIFHQIVNSLKQYVETEAF